MCSRNIFRQWSGTVLALSCRYLSDGDWANLLSTLSGANIYTWHWGKFSRLLYRWDIIFNFLTPYSPLRLQTYHPTVGMTVWLVNGENQSIVLATTLTEYQLSFTEVDTCVSSPCINGGTCVNTKESYRCDCAPGYNGQDCENEINECVSSPCYQQATCVDKVYLCEI